jgi:hypothetical protein
MKKIKLYQYKGKLIEVFNLTCPEFNGWLTDSVNFNYYGLLASFSNKIQNKIILDLGTSHGYSAFVLGENKKNTVRSYDIERNHISEEKIKEINTEYPNIDFRLQDCLEIPLEEIKNSSLIFLDIAPHDGIQENKMMQKIREAEFSGLLVCDDIGTFFGPGMRGWWESIREIKYELAGISYAGTGFVFFTEKSYNIFCEEEEVD